MTAALISYERVAQLADLRVETELPAHSWGVWCFHERRWIAGTGYGPAAERSAHTALAETDSLHPWELSVVQADADGCGPRARDELRSRTRPGGKPSGRRECPDCDGGGSCDCCGHTCDRCDGDGWLDL